MCASCVSKQEEEQEDEEEEEEQIILSCHQPPPVLLHRALDLLLRPLDTGAETVSTAALTSRVILPGAVVLNNSDLTQWDNYDPSN